MLSDQHKRQIIDEGYVQLPGVIPPERVNAARRVINASLGANGLPPDKLPIYAAQSYCPELRETDAIAGLFRDTPVITLAESLLGPVNVPAAGQVALRFPRATINPGEEPPPVRGHIDGIATPTNGVKPGTLASFTMLAGVLLSDLPDEYAGNFTVFPGSHDRFGAWFRDHDPIEMAGGMPPVEHGQPRQVTGKAGDVVFAHYLTCHGIAANLSPNIRYAIFFRVNPKGRHGYRPEAIRDMWLDWVGLHPLLGR
jgi:hypothetical protein